MERAVTSAIQIWRQFTVTRYLAASIAALGCDMLIFASLIVFHVDPTIASAIGYCAGIVCHWTISVNYVFVGKSHSGPGSFLQRVMFAGSALIGLAITVATVEIIGRGGADPVSAKIVAIAISFVAVYLMRKWGVFK